MLERLNQIDWAALRHAHGPAGNLPALLRELAADDPARRSEALWACYETIWHQGAVAEAAAHAVPFLLELLATPHLQEKDQILLLLTHLACGQRVRAARAARAAVGAGADLYLALLSGEPAATRAAAAGALACCESRARRLVPALGALLAAEPDALVRASIALALGRLGRDRQPAAALLRGIVAGSQPGVVRCAAALALAYAAGPLLDQPSAQIMADLLGQPEICRLLDDWYSDKYCRAYGGLASFLERLRPEQALLAGRALERGLAEADDGWPPAAGASGGQTARPPR